MKRFWSWLFWDSHIPLGHLAPFVLGLSIGRMPHRVEPEKEDDGKV